MANQQTSRGKNIMKSYRPVVVTKQSLRSASSVTFNSDRPAHRLARGCALAILLGLATITSAADFYVSPTGSSSGAGSQAGPWDLQTALNQPAAVKPGDTVWLKAGRYQGVFNANLTGTSAAPIKVRPVPGDRAIIDNSSNIYISTLTVNGSYTWYWGFEIASSNTNRYSSQSGSWPTDIPNGGGLVTGNQGTGNKFINLLVHDNPFGVGIWNGAVNIDTYGCLIYYNGWMGTDRTHGHGIYGQNSQPSVKRVQDCLIFYNSDHGSQFYGTTTAPIDNFQITGNAYFNNSDLFAGVTSGRNLLVGGGMIANNSVITSNCLYRSSSEMSISSSYFDLGYGTGDNNTVMTANYMVGSALFSGSLDIGLNMNNNMIYGTLTSLNTAQYPNNTYTTTHPTCTKVVVRPNQYENGRANIIIYNWDLASAVTVSLAGAGLNTGDTYELHNAMNYFGDVITGTYNGTSISVPMTGHTIGSPSGLPAPKSPFPEFGAFVLIKKSSGAVGNTAPTIASIGNQTVNDGVSTGPLAFTVGDAETAASNLTVKAGSSNPTLVPASGLVLGGSGANRTATVTPVTNQTGSATITLTVSDGSLSNSTSFTLTVNAVTTNTPPTISNVPNQSINTGTTTAPLAFTVSDAQTAAGSLTVTVGSWNTTLVPLSNIVLGGSGSNRTVTVTPAAGQTGTTQIDLVVSDGILKTITSFTLTVNAVAVNIPPTISNVPNQTINTGTSTAPLAFTVGDAQTAAGNLTVTVGSWNTTLVPLNNIVLGGSGSNRTVTVTPAAGQTGTTQIDLVVSDGILKTATSFTLTVNAVAVNIPPTISNVPNQTINTGASTAPLAFTVGDAQTAAGSLTVTVGSWNTTLVPLNNIVLGGSGSNRTVTVTPAAGQTGTTQIDLVVSDGILKTATSFTLTVNAVAVNIPPTISNVPNQTINTGASTAPLAFTVGDAQTAAGSLTVTVGSWNTTLVPLNNIVLGGSGSNRTVTVTPAAGQTGTTQIDLVVSDGILKTATSFTLTVNAVAVNIPPTISNVPNQTINTGASTAPLAFTVGDAQTAAGSLTVTVGSWNTTLVPLNNIVLGGSGSNRTVTVTPAAGQTGTTQIDLVVSDGILKTTTSFTLTVNAVAVNIPPTISNVPNQTINTGASTAPLAFTVGDAQTAAGSLTVTVGSWNTTLVPLNNIVLGGSGSNRTVTVTPAAGQTGTTQIDLVVS